MGSHDDVLRKQRRQVRRESDDVAHHPDVVKSLMLLQVGSSLLLWYEIQVHLLEGEISRLTIELLHVAVAKSPFPELRAEQVEFKATQCKVLIKEGSHTFEKRCSEARSATRAAQASRPTALT